MAGYAGLRTVKAIGRLPRRHTLGGTHMTTRIDTPLYVAVCPDCGHSEGLHVEPSDRWSVTHRDAVVHESGRPKRVMELYHYGSGERVK